ncbi:MAG: carboxypeptidase-like regulatory domain-containing protein [Saprospiraceae bacterium]|nr:carboxypeptidase-like regulatory domain-containing protein [Saprospiraceae bacterium]
MKQFDKLFFATVLCFLMSAITTWGQSVTIKGKVVDGETGEELIGASIVVLTGGTGGASTDYEGNFTLKLEKTPARIRVSYTGYDPSELDITSPEGRLSVKLSQASNILEDVIVRGQRIDEKQKTAPLSVENLDAIAIKETPAVSFYNGLGNLKGVDLTTASLGFTIINMRGFNSTSPVRSLQIIDGVDNQAPGLNFSLGNFLGASDLDVNGVELVSGASGPFFGPNAFNGVISIKTKDPFVTKGLSASLKTGERNLFEVAMRWADAFKNKKGQEFLAYKLNFFHLRAYDWVADNYEPVENVPFNSPVFTAKENPGRYDAVNRYGDEYSSLFDYTRFSPWDDFYGIQQFHRQGYKEEDLVDYNTRNYKASASLHWRLNPSKEYESAELIYASSFGNGTTVYQGDNRFSLRNILFFQNRLELRKKDRYFLRAYATNEDAGDSYDPYFTALRLQENAKSDELFRNDYRSYWVSTAKYQEKMRQMGYPQLALVGFDPVTGLPIFEFDQAAANAWFKDHQELLAGWHQTALENANAKSSDGTSNYYQPGTAEFQREFDRITSAKSGRDGGTRFFDKSALYHVHGEYRFTPNWFDQITVGANTRIYRPYSEGTIFIDTLQYTRDANNVAIDSFYERITNWEVGGYAGVEKKFMSDRMIASATLRLDKNQNFDVLATPAASLVYAPDKVNFLRFSFSSAIRNPTLTDQYLNLNVGRATLLGNLNGFDSLITVESLREALKPAFGADVSKLKYFNAPAIKPEKVKAFELGYRTTIWNKLYMDAGYYYNIYDNFIGYNLGVTAKVISSTIDLNSIKAYRVSANSTNTVTTQGFNIGLNYYFSNLYQLSGNYSFNKLNKTFPDDPIIPAFNTPTHKFNVGFSGRDIKIGRLKNTGFNVTYKWIEGFLFEGSPQFTGFIPTYDMVDAQWNCRFEKIKTTLKIGATNILGLQPLFEDAPEGSTKLKEMFNNNQYQTYGGPRIGRMAYVSLTYNFDKK